MSVTERKRVEIISRKQLNTPAKPINNMSNRKE